MANKKWSLPPEATLNELSGYLEDLREQYEEMSDKWKDSEKGEAIEDWLDTLDGLVDAYEDVVQELDEHREPQ